MTATYDRDSIRTALALADPAISSYLDLETGAVVAVDASDEGPAMQQLSNQVMDGYGDRYRYIPGGNSAVDDTAITQWLESEGL